MIPEKYEQILFAAILSGLMSLLVSGISTVRTFGLAVGLAGEWAGAWLTAWPIAFPVVVLIAPLARKLVRLLTGAGRGERAPR